MSKKATVKVRLDTRGAKADLKGLTKEGEATAARVNKDVGGFGRAATMGAVAGAGFGLAQRAASRVAGFMPDVISEGTAGFRARIDDALGGVDARASRGAREDTKAAWSEIVGRMKDPQVTPEIRNYYNNVKGLKEITERGNTEIDKAFGGDIIKDAFEGLTKTITEGFDKIKAALPIGGK